MLGRAYKPNWKCLECCDRGLSFTLGCLGVSEYEEILIDVILSSQSLNITSRNPAWCSGIFNYFLMQYNCGGQLIPQVLLAWESTISMGKGWAYGPIPSPRIREHPRTTSEGRNENYTLGRGKGYICGT